MFDLFLGEEIPVSHTVNGRITIYQLHIIRLTAHEQHARVTSGLDQPARDFEDCRLHGLVYVRHEDMREEMLDCFHTACVSHVDVTVMSHPETCHGEL